MLTCSETFAIDMQNNETHLGVPYPTFSSLLSPLSVFKVK